MEASARHKFSALLIFFFCLEVKICQSLMFTVDIIAHAQQKIAWKFTKLTVMILKIFSPMSLVAGKTSLFNNDWGL